MQDVNDGTMEEPKDVRRGPGRPKRTPEEIAAAEEEKKKKEEGKRAEEAMEKRKVVAIAVALFARTTPHGASRDVIYLLDRPSTSSGRKTVRTVAGTDGRAIKDALVSGAAWSPEVATIIEAARERGMSLGELATLVSDRLNETAHLPAVPPNISWEKDGYAFGWFNQEDLRAAEGQPTPAWDQFLARMTRPKLFLAWLWSSFNPRLLGRQVFWLHGEGGDGKSVVANAISRMHGQGAAALSSASVGSQFFFSFMLGKSFANWPDCPNAKALHMANIKCLTGGDAVSIEFKGFQAYQARVHAAVLVTSNLAPEVHMHEASETSRILYDYVRRPPEDLPESGYDWAEALWQERWALLAKARAAFAEVGDERRGGVKVGDEVRASLELLASSETNAAEHFIAGHLKFEPAAFTSSVDLRTRLHSAYPQMDLEFLFRAVSATIKSRGAERAQRRIPGGKLTGYGGVRLLGIEQRISPSP